MLQDILHYDQQLFFLINGEWHHPWIDAIMPIWRDKKTWIPLYLILAAFSLYRFGWWKGLVFIAAIGLTVGLADTMSSKVLKKSVQRLRPCNDTQVQAEVRLVDDCGKSYSFTSSHAANHFALATFLALTLGRLYRGLGTAFLLWAASIAYGQVYIGVHYPLDVIFGALAGMLIAYVMAKLYLRLDVSILSPQA